jgi:hypothetical protein
LAVPRINESTPKRNDPPAWSHSHTASTALAAAPQPPSPPPPPLFPPPQNLDRQHQMIEPFQVQLFERVAFDPGPDHAKDARGGHDLVRLGFVARPRGEVGDAADRGVAGMNAIAFTRNFPAPLAKNRGKKCELLERLGVLIPAVSSLISDFPKDISVPTYPKSHLELFASHPTRGAYRDRHGRGVRMRWTRQRQA